MGLKETERGGKVNMVVFLHVVVQHAAMEQLFSLLDLFSKLSFSCCGSCKHVAKLKIEHIQPRSG